MPLPFSRPAVIRLRRCRGGSQIRPPSVDPDVRRARRLGAPPHRVSPFGRVPFSAAKKEPKRRRGWAPMGVPAHSRATPEPPFTGDTPTPLCKISDAQNTAPGFDSFRATGPWFCAKFRFVPFHRRAWFRPAVADGTGRGAHRTEPFRKQKTGGPVSRPYGVSDKSPGQREGQASLLWGDGEAFCGGRLHGTAPTQGNTPRCRPGRGGATLSPTGARGPQCAPTQKFPAPGDNSL